MRLRARALCALLLPPTFISCAAEQPTSSPGCVSAPSVTAAVAADAAQGRPAVAIAAHDDRFAPECIQTAAAGELLVVLRNEGDHPHNLTVPGGRSIGVDAGQVALMVVPVGPDGIRYVCTIHPGMNGHIRVGA